MFIVGALLAKHIPFIKDKISSLSITSKVCILIAGLLFYENSDWILRGHLLQLKASDDIETFIGATILISVALSWRGFSVFLKLRPILFLGKISLSLYLFHAIVRLCVTYLVHDLVPLWMIWIIILVASILLSTITYHFITPVDEIGAYPG
jgi:peptidoglycan/LPS O-acetylase OafA/YrhL